MRKPPVVGQHSPGITAAQQPLPLTNYAGAAKEPSIEQRLPPTRKYNAHTAHCVFAEDSAVTDNVTTALNNMSALAKAVESLSVTQQISVNTVRTRTSCARLKATAGQDKHIVVDARVATTGRHKNSSIGRINTANTRLGTCAIAGRHRVVVVGCIRVN
jgi:hypothetical protein